MQHQHHDQRGKENRVEHDNAERGGRDSPLRVEDCSRDSDHSGHRHVGDGETQECDRVRKALAGAVESRR
jgi:hypothetical protein